VAHFEGLNAGDQNNVVRVLNGFVVLAVQGRDVTESFYDENGAVLFRIFRENPYGICTRHRAQEAKN
jgi:hypothetical protein